MAKDKQDKTYSMGEKPGAGEYKCVNCDDEWSVTLDNDDDMLPPCGNCGEGVDPEYRRVG